MILEKGDILTRLGRSELIIMASPAKNSRIMGPKFISDLGRRMTEKIPGLADFFHNEMKRKKWYSSHYYFDTFNFESDLAGSVTLGLFQVSNLSAGPIDLGIVRYATSNLFAHLIHLSMDIHPTGFRVDMEFPNIKGEMSHGRKETQSILSLLPDIVHVWPPEGEQSQQLQLIDI